MRIAVPIALLAVVAACSRSEEELVAEARDGCRRLRETIRSTHGLRPRWTPVESVLGSPLTYSVFWRRFVRHEREPFWEERYRRRHIGLDPWGHPYEVGDAFYWWFFEMFGWMSSAFSELLEVRSAGPDGKYGTGDDIVDCGRRG